MIDKSEIILQELREAGLPKLRIRNKDESWFWRMLPSAWRTCSVTTIGSTIWVPSATWLRYASPVRLACTMAHEARHAEDWGFRFLAAYLAPQAFLLAAVVTIWAIVGGLFPLSTSIHLCLGAGLLCSLAPWPSPWRRRAELRGYVTGAGVEIELTGKLSKATTDAIEAALTGPVYWWMVWDKDRARGMADALRDVVTTMHEDVAGANPLRSDRLVRAAVRGASRMVE